MALPEWPSVIRASVVAVVIISACGLLSLAFYGRLAAVFRLRGFQREILKEQENPSLSGGIAAGETAAIAAKANGGSGQGCYGWHCCFFCRQRRF